MIMKFLLKNTNVNEVLVLDMASFFYNDELNDGEIYKANEKTGLNYFGEYLERHEDRGISCEEIMAAVCLRQYNNLEDIQIFDGQYEMFVKRVENKRKENGFNFELEMLYSMFLFKMKKEEHGAKIFKDILSNMTLDNTLLVVVGLIEHSYIRINEECRQIIAKRLKGEKIKLSIDSFINRLKNGEYYLSFKSEFMYLKYIMRSFDLKKSHFKDSANTFQNLKNLKKVGTRDGLYSVVKDILEIEEDKFYLMSIKIANDTYADGPSLGRTNEFLVEHLEKCISVNNSWYYELTNIRIRGESQRYRNEISLKNVIFYDVKEEYFDSLINAFGCYNTTLNYKQIKEVCISEKFISFVKNKEKELKPLDKKFMLKVIKYEDDFVIKQKYYDVIKDCKDIDSSDICLFCKENLVSSDYIIKTIIKEKENKLTMDFSAKDIVDTCIYGNMFDVLIKIAEKLVSNKVIVDRYVKNSFINLSKIIERNLNLEALQKCNKKELIKLLDNFNFMYLSEQYNSFIVRNLNNHIFVEALELGEEDILEISNYLIGKNYISRENEQTLKKIILSEDDIYMEGFRNEMETYCNEYRYYKGNFKVCDSLRNMIASRADKTIIVSYLNKLLDSFSKDKSDDIKFFGLIKLIVDTDLMNEDEVMDILKNRLFESVICK